MSLVLYMLMCLNTRSINNIYIYIYIRIYIYILNMFMHINMWNIIYIYISTHAYIRKYVRTFIHTYIYIHTVPSKRTQPLHQVENDLTHWKAWLKGPEGTPCAREALTNPVATFTHKYSKVGIPPNTAVFLWVLLRGKIQWTDKSNFAPVRSPGRIRFPNIHTNRQWFQSGANGFRPSTGVPPNSWFSFGFPLNPPEERAPSFKRKRPNGALDTGLGRALMKINWHARGRSQKMPGKGRRSVCGPFASLLIAPRETV